MSAAVYSEPGKLPAGILAVAVHGAFFALLYFGFTWQTSPPVMMSVELWDSLPAMAVAPPPPEKVIEPDIVPPVPVKIEEVAQPEKVPEKVIEPPDIAIPDKQKTALESARLAKLKRDQAERSKAEREQAERVQAERKQAERKQAEREQAEREQAEREQAEREQAEREQAEREQAAREQAARAQAEKEAAIGKVVDEYRAKIMAKIRRNIVMPANVADEARAEFSVTLLPGGAVLEARLLKASGNAAYDGAVERAIIKSDPLPLPPDVALFNKFRKLNLVFKPTE